MFLAFELASWTSSNIRPLFQQTALADWGLAAKFCLLSCACASLIYVNALQILHSISKERLELINGLEPYVAEKVLPLLKPVDKCWQPADYLPDPSKGDYLDQVGLPWIAAVKW